MSGNNLVSILLLIFLESHDQWLSWIISYIKNFPPNEKVSKTKQTLSNTDNRTLGLNVLPLNSFTFRENAAWAKALWTMGAIYIYSTLIGATIQNVIYLVYLRPCTGSLEDLAHSLMINILTTELPLLTQMQLLKCFKCTFIIVCLPSLLSRHQWNHVI